MEAIQINFVNKSNNPTPKFQTEGAAGVDLCAFLEDEVILKPKERKLIPTGNFIELPIGFEAQIRPRSGLALKYGVTVLNAPGTIDCDYRGEIKVLLINHSEEDFLVKNGDRIAQMVIAEYKRTTFNIVALLSETERGAGGYGHTGR